MTIKEVFEKAENGTLTFDQFQAAMGTAKFVDLTEGQYVSKQKFDDEIGQRDTRITTLQDTIQTRDTDLTKLQQTLSEAGDLEALKKASQDLTDLQQRYDTETKQYQKQLKQQAYEFAVKEYVNGQQFTSKAAKNDFTNAMIAKKLQFEEGVLIGADDFKTIYAQNDPEAFATAKLSEPTPRFVEPTTPSTPAKPTLTELMQMKNEHPEAIINF